MTYTVQESNELCQKMEMERKYAHIIVMFYAQRINICPFPDLVTLLCLFWRNEYEFRRRLHPLSLSLLPPVCITALQESICLVVMLAYIPGAFDCTRFSFRGCCMHMMKLVVVVLKMHKSNFVSVVNWSRRLVL